MDEAEVIRQSIAQYFEVLNEIAMDPDGDPDGLSKVAAGRQLELQRSTLEMLRARGWVASNPIVVRNIEVGDVSVRNDLYTVESTLCMDSSKVEVVDVEGEVQIDKSGSGLVSSTVTLNSTDQGKTWMVVEAVDGGGACEE